MLYHMHDLQYAIFTPARLSAELMRTVYSHPWNPWSYTQAGRSLAASAEMFERATRRFGKPEFGLTTTMIDGQAVALTEEIIAEKPFCRLLHFQRATTRRDPRVLLVAPMSGHHATLLRGTVQGLLPHHDVYVTDWLDARQVPKKAGKFNLDSYITYLREFLSLLGPDTHVIAVCQPAVPVFAAIALMEAENDPNTPRTMTLMGGPIDTRVSKTKVTETAEERPLSWFENTVCTEVPAWYPGANRQVYPGFIQLGGFMSMNLDRHVGANMKFYQHLMRGDGSSAESHRKFYNEYNSVMDITAEFYLQTVETVFQKQLLPKGLMKWRDPFTDQLVDVNPKAIKHCAILTVEGELDDISAHGQTTAAHLISTSLPPEKHFHHFQENVGHYGIFNGRKWREQIGPRIRHFIRDFTPEADPIPAADLKAFPDLAPEQWDVSKHAVEVVRARLAGKEKSKEMEDA